MIRARHSVPGAALAALLLAAPAAAQVPLAPRAVGTGGAYVGLARGHDAVFLNPANLGLSDNPRWSVALPQVLAGAAVRGPALGDVRDFLDYDDLTEQQRADLLATVPASGAALEADLRVPVAVIQSGGFGFGVAYGVAGEHAVSRDLVELFLEGYDPGRTDYTLRGTEGRRASYLDFAAAYGRSVGPLSVGVTGHYYRGRSLSKTRAFDPEYLDVLVTRDIQVHYVGVASEGGSGFGVDVGAALEPVPGLVVSAAVANAVSSFSWDEELVGRRVVLSRDDFSADFQTVYNQYKASGTRIGADPADPRFAAVAAELFEDAELPTTLRVGAAWSLPGGTTGVSAAYHTDLSEGKLAGRWESLLGVGVEQRLAFLTARVGVSSNLDEGSMIGGGLTLGPVNLGVARLSDAEDDGAGRNGWIASFGLSARPRR